MNDGLNRKHVMREDHANEKQRSLISRVVGDWMENGQQQYREARRLKAGSMDATTERNTGRFIIIIIK